MTASRTRGKLKENLTRYIMGFDGSTVDATWFRVFRDSFNEIFTKEITGTSGKSISLSTEIGLIGNEKIAFDELLNGFFTYLFHQKCQDSGKLLIWNHEISCKSCSTNKDFPQNCIWGILIEAAGKENFLNPKYKIIDWLINIHSFNTINKDTLTKKITQYFTNIFTTQFIPLCEIHNMNIANKKIINSETRYPYSKESIFKEYNPKYDNRISLIEFIKKTI